MKNIDALVLPYCIPRHHPEGWGFPCGMTISQQYGEGPTDEYQPLQGAAGRTAHYGTPNFLTLAHLLHHQDQHDELDTFIIVEVRGPDNDLVDVWCQCRRDDAHWHYLNQFDYAIPEGGMP